MPVLTNKRQELFATLIALKGRNACQAYTEAGYTGAAKGQAWKMQNVPHVLARIEELQGVLRDRATIDKVEAIDFLARVVRTPIGEVTARSPLCQEMTRTTIGKRILISMAEVERLR